ncbi:MAG: NTP transferase domain-containing protein [Sandaracinaceae bacterium]
MTPRPAIVLAAGSGRRLRPHTDRRPKPLVEVAGQPMLTRILAQLRDAGVSEFVVVVGDRAVQIETALAGAEGVRFVEAPDYANTNNASSLQRVGDVLRSGAFVIEGDVVCDPSIVHALVAADPTHPHWAVRPFLPGMDGALLSGTPGGPLTALRLVRNPPPDAHYDGYKSMGMLALPATYGAQLADWLDAEAAAGRTDRYFDLVIESHLALAAPRLLVLDEGRWMEVDTPEDLAEARRLFG